MTKVTQHLVANLFVITASFAMVLELFFVNPKAAGCRTWWL